MTGNIANRQREQYDRLVSLMRVIVHHDAQLREQYAVGERFRFVRDQLLGLLAELEAAAPAPCVSEEPAQQHKPGETGREVYIYLYNAQGAVVRSWAALLTARALYDHSINRPVYTEISEVQTLLRGKSNPAQHAFLTIRVAESDLLQLEGKTDAAGKPLFRVKEGVLKPECFISLTHNDHEYLLNPQGELVRREEPPAPPG